MYRLTFAISIGLALAATPPLRAEEDIFNLIDNNAQNAKSFRLDLNTPTAPGFAVIGASPKEIVDPGNLQEFAVHTASFVENGNLKPGLAMNVQPFWLYNSDITLSEYVGRDLAGNEVDGLGSVGRILARTQLSFASVEGKSPASSKGARFGLGFHTELLDGPDSRNLASARCVIRAFEENSKPIESAVLSIKTQIEVESAKDPTLDRDLIAEKVAEKVFDDLKTPDYDAAIAQCREQAERRTLSAVSWIVGGGVAASSSDTSLDHLEFAGASVWTTYRIPFSSNKAFTLFGKADIDQDFDVAGAIHQANFYHVAASISLTEPSWKLDASASYHLRDSTSFNEDYFQFGIDGAYKLRKGAWIEASAGVRTGSQFEDDQFALVQLKLDLSETIDNLAK